MGKFICEKLSRWVLSKKFPKKILKKITKKLKDYTEEEARLALIFLNEKARLSKYMLFVATSVLLVTISLWFPIYYLVELIDISSINMTLLYLILSFLTFEIVRPLFFQPLLLALEISKASPKLVEKYYKKKAEMLKR